MTFSLGSFTFNKNELLKAPCTERYDLQETKLAQAASQVEHNGRFGRSWTLSGFLYDAGATTYLERMSSLLAVTRSSTPFDYTDTDRIPDTGNKVSVLASSVSFGDPFETKGGAGAISFTIHVVEVS